MSQLILIVDDDAELRNIYRHALERAGYSTVEAANGIEALQTIEAYFPALVIMDMAMPKMGGSELLEKIQGNPETAALPIIIVTARPEYRDMAGELDVARFFLKPVGPNEIVEAIDEILNS